MPFNDRRQLLYGAVILVLSIILLLAAFVFIANWFGFGS
jgi:hypothetical protein